MKGSRSFLCVVLCMFSIATVSAQEAAKPEYIPGVTLSQGITEITGVAISPLLGVSSVGAWRYWKTPAAGRAELPWYAQPWAWGTGLVVLSLCFLKDSLGTAVPGLLKKPFDMVELFENKASALVASTAFVPLIAEEMVKHFQSEREISMPKAFILDPGLATIDAAWLMVPLAIVAFLLVWVCSHAINVLIILSPFSSLDALLKLMRTGVLVVVSLAYLIAPWLAAAFCLALIAVAAWLAPAALRLAIFGASFAADILLPGRGRKRATPEQPHAFTLGCVAGLPSRTGGRLILSADGGVAFCYRRWWVCDEVTVPLPQGPRMVEKGVLSPSLVHRAGEPDEMKLLIFLPRYRGQEEFMVRHLELHGVRDHALLRGLGAVKKWVRGMLPAGSPKIEASL